MTRTVRLYIATMALSAASLGTTGCQTYQVGQVLPSGGHMYDDLQYFPKGPQFPLTNELNAMKGAEEERQIDDF